MTTTIFELRDFDNSQSYQLYATLNGVATYFQNKGVERFWMFGADGKIYFDMDVEGLKQAMDYTKSYIGDNTRTSIRYSIEVMPGMVFDCQYLLTTTIVND